MATATAKNVGKVTQVFPVGVFVVARGVRIPTGLRHDAFHQPPHKPVVAGIEERAGDKLNDGWRPPRFSGEACDNGVELLSHLHIVLKDGEELRGTIEWYDRNALKVHRPDAPNILLMKDNVKYMFKENEDQGGDVD